MNKIQKISAVLAAVALTAATQVSAMTENWTALVSRFLTLQGGTTAVAQGSLMKLGVITTTEAALFAAQDNVTTVNNAFNAWTTGLVGDGSPIDGTFSESTSADGTGFFSTKLYILAFNAPTVGAATQWGLFSSTDANWISPASNAADPGGIELSDAGLYAIIGALSSGTVTDPSDIAGTDAAQLHAVPEPSSLMLVGLGILGMVGLKRRRS